MQKSTKQPLMNAFLAVLMAAAASQLPNIARANSPSGVATVQVQHLDLDPASDAAARRVLRRLSEAALEACGASAFSLKDVQDAVRATRCWHDSLSDVVARIDSPRLTTAFETQIERKRHAS